jgi:hypothetical protein
MALIPKGTAYEKVVKEAARRERMDRLGGTRTEYPTYPHLLGSNDKLGKKLKKLFTNLNSRYS